MVKVKQVNGKIEDLNGFKLKKQDKNYVKRPVEDQVIKIMEMPLENRKPIFLLGESAVGKTAMVRNIALNKDLPFLLIEVDVSLNFNDLLYKVRFENATAHYEEGLLIKFLQQPCVIMFDELPAANAEIFFKLHELLQERRIYVKELGKIFEVHENCYIFAAGNFKNAMYIGNNRMNAALISRFMVRVIEDFSKSEIEMIIDYDDKAVKSSLVDFYFRVKEIIKKQQKRYQITIRNLQSITELLNIKFSMNDAIQFGLLDSIMVNNTEDELLAVKDLAMATLPGYKINNEDMEKIKKSKSRY